MGCLSHHWLGQNRQNPKTMSDTIGTIFTIILGAILFWLAWVIF